MTETIAMVGGPYLLVTGLGFLTATDFYTRMSAEADRTDPVSLNLSGAVHFIVGLIILAQHWNWGGVAETIVTVLGVAAAAKGTSLIVAPALTLKSRQSTTTAIRLSSVLFIPVGAYLTYYGYVA